MTNAELEQAIIELKKSIINSNSDEEVELVKSIIENKINESYASLQTMFVARLEDLTSKLESTIEQKISAKLEQLTK